LLFCSRDRLGQKPFYYYYRDGKFVFSSELKAIHKHNALNLDKSGSLNKEAVEYYFGLGFIPSPLSIYKDIYKLEAGQNLVFDIRRKTLRIWRYYEHPPYEPLNDRTALVEQGKQLLHDATKIRLVADVPVGAFLSGGLDSSTVVGVMKDFVDLHHLHTLSVGFEGKWDESSYIETVKDHFSTRHHHHYFRKVDFENLINRHAIIFDEPLDDPSGFPMHYISSIASRDVTVENGDRFISLYFSGLSFMTRHW
jgi:asparagine synthase (glutamine-hydrolysing)